MLNFVRLVGEVKRGESGIKTLAEQLQGGERREGKRETLILENNIRSSSKHKNRSRSLFDFFLSIRVLQYSLQLLFRG